MSSPLISITFFKPAWRLNADGAIEGAQPSLASSTMISPKAHTPAFAGCTSIYSSVPKETVPRLFRNLTPPIYTLAARPEVLNTSTVHHVTFTLLALPSRSSPQRTQLRGAQHCEDVSSFCYSSFFYCACVYLFLFISRAHYYIWSLCEERPFAPFHTLLIGEAYLIYPEGF